MATILDDEDTIEAQSLSTSLDPYGQLMKMLMPRALYIAIYDRMATPLWLSDGCEGPDLPQLVEEALNSARSPEPDPAERDGFARSWDGDTAYIFILREGTDYGVREFSLEEKVLHVRKQLDSGHAVVAFDPNVESCSIVKKEELRKL